jgi:dTDP-glucose 4,6-dehydratase
MKKILITGSCGFIGSNFVRYATYNKLPYQISSVDKLVYQHSKNNLYINKDHNFYMGDISDFHFMKNVFELEKPHIVINFAAETHVDQSIENPLNIIDVNVKGTQVLLDLAVKNKIEKFVQVSTDEVYGHLNDGDKPWTEEDKTNPRNPYSASKLGAEHLVRACHNTFGLNYIITRSCNNFGIRQSTRNLIPKIIKNVSAGEVMPIYGTGMNVRNGYQQKIMCRQS